MVTNKEKVFDFMIRYAKGLNTLDDEMKLDTSFISAQVGIQRSNVSTILNQLVEEGKVIKHKGRPVLYSLSKTVKSEVNDQSFASLIGCRSSLQQAIQYTKAAIAYPKKIPKILYIGERGTGIQRFSREAYEYACSNGILKKDAPYYVMNCFRYGEQRLENILIGDNSLLRKNNHGLLVLKNADQLSPYLIEKMMEHYLTEEDLQMILIIHIVDPNKADLFKEYINFIIHLPSLNQRSKEERYQLIELFFKKEAERLNRRIEVDRELMQCLMAYPCRENCDSLKNDIQFGIANAFLKSKKKGNIKLELVDFPDTVRRGLLYTPPELEKVIRKDISTYIFEKDQTYYLRNKEKNSDIYHRLDHKKKMLRNSTDDRERNNFVLVNIEGDMEDYFRQLTEGVDDTKLEKTVSEKLRNLVNSFLTQASLNLKREYSKQIYYGLCLHLNNAIIIKKPRQRISNENVMEIMEKYDKECLISRIFIKEIQNEFNVKFSIDETIFITLILALDFESTPQKSEVETLVVMHGESAASSIVESIRYLVPMHNIDAFNLSWNDDMDTAYEKLKQKVISCDKGKGVLVIYDTGSIQVMLNSIKADTNIEIRSLEVPLSLLAMSSCKHSRAGKTVDEIYRHLIREYSYIAFLNQ